MLLVPGLHLPRLALTFLHALLSSSWSFSYGLISLFLFCTLKIIIGNPWQVKGFPLFSVLYFLCRPLVSAAAVMLPVVGMMFSVSVMGMMPVVMVMPAPSAPLQPAPDCSQGKEKDDRSDRDQKRPADRRRIFPVRILLFRRLRLPERSVLAHLYFRHTDRIIFIKIRQYRRVRSSRNMRKALVKIGKRCPFRQRYGRAFRDLCNFIAARFLTRHAAEVSERIVEKGLCI